MSRKSTRQERNTDTPGVEAVMQVADAVGRRLSRDEASSLSVYLNTLMAWNRKMNLVGPDSWQDVLATLVVDSWKLADLLDGLMTAASPRALDLGSGAGLPGVPLRIFWSQGNLHLVEIRRKRTAFLRYVVSRMNLGHSTHIEECRVESLPEELRGADLVLGRAFMPWREYLALAAGLLAPGGHVVVFANEPVPPAEEHPADLRLVMEREYRVRGQKRYFWVFTPVIIPR